MTRDLTTAALVLRLPRSSTNRMATRRTSPRRCRRCWRQPPASAAKLSRLARREAFVWKHAEGYVTITSGLRREIANRFGGASVPWRCRTVRGSCRSRPRSGSAVHGRLYAGHLPDEGVDVLIDALAVLPPSARSSSAATSEPDLARLCAKATALGLDARVTFTGHVAPAAVPARLAAADVLVLQAGIGDLDARDVAIEALRCMAAGRAIVAKSDLPAIREVLTHGVNAVLVPPGDPAALADGIRSLEADAPMRARLADAARTAVADAGWSRRAERLESLFTAVVNAAGPARR